MMRVTFLIIAGLFFCLTGEAQVWLFDQFPRTYVAYRATSPISTDGLLDESDWQNVPWTEDFVDIEGDKMPAPLHRTRVKMLWDDDYLYIAAELDEPHIWATYTERNSVIFHENNFEVFIDPNGDTHNYYEYEVNALGTEWDLFLTKPYRNAGIPMSAWHITGLEKGIHLKGSINDPSDTDTLWRIELAFPWKILSECAPGRRRPRASEQWRMNFSRVEWRLDISEGKYVKRINPETGKHFPEYNWVWSPQGVIDMHRPESWGFVQFSDLSAGQGKDDFVINPDEYIKFALREFYYLQLAYKRNNGIYALKQNDLTRENIKVNGKVFKPDFEVSRTRFKLSFPSNDGKSSWHIVEDGRIWKE
ncbi:MAG: carbohydrate-binding family 9-like protein [Bacteroidales bacterium]